ncbi:MAG TPA: DUF3631 domain-containing protein, partial [Fimbriimonas sp.]|nr:DUF3631 domain-containing protein [Fimbriimonas sp.]
PEMPPGVRNRSKDNWRPLLAIADLAGGDWPAIARSAAQHLLGHKETEEKSLGVRLLMDIRSVLTAASMSSSVLCNALADLEEAPWAEFGKKGKPINQRDLAKLLRAYGISTRDDRFGGSRVLKGYMRAMFDEAFDRYLPSIPSATPQHQPVTDIGGHAGMTTDVADGLMQMESVDPIRNTTNDQRGLSANVEGHAQENCCCVADQILQREHGVFDDSAAREVIYL